MLTVEVVTVTLVNMAASMPKQSQMPPFSNATVDGFLIALRAMDVTNEEFKNACAVILRTREWFPAPKVVCDEIERQRAAKAAPVRLILCLDENGIEVSADSRYVHDGRYVPKAKRDAAPPGWTPNGLPYEPPTQELSGRTINIVDRLKSLGKSF